MKLESTAEIKPQRRDERREEAWNKTSALIAVQIQRITHFEQGFTLRVY